MSTPEQPNQPPAYTPPPAPPSAPAYQGAPTPPVAPAAPAAPGYGAPTAPAAPGYAAPGAPAYAAPYGAAPEAVPGRGLAIAGIILAFFAPLVGLILSLVARSKLKKAGAPTGLATAGFWIGLALTIIGLIVGIITIVVFANLFSMCAQLGPGVWEVDGTTYTCS